MQTNKTIRARRTIKLKANPDNPLPVNDDPEFSETVEELIETAGLAPFHYTSAEFYQKEGKLTGKEPWRFYAIDSKNCRNMMSILKADKLIKTSEGILQMLAAADALILVTWLPEPSASKSKKFYPNVKNMEHMAATGAAIQNLLLAATEKGITNYWSSGGVLRKPQVMDKLGISIQEILLGAIFLFPDPDKSDAEMITGKNREIRSGKEKWMEWVTF